MMTKGCRAFLMAGSGSCGSPKQRRGCARRRKRAHARPQGHRSCGGAPPRPRPTRGHEGLTQKARKFSARNICPNLDSRSKTDLESQRTEKTPFKSARRLSAKRAPGRNRARDHPLQRRRTQDHRATSPAAGLRRAHGSAAAKRARPRKRANLSALQNLRFWPQTWI